MDDRETRDSREADPQELPSRTETIGRMLFLFGGGVLLSVLVSCACGPTR